MQATATAHDVGKHLLAASIAHVVLKGPVLAETCYPRPDLRWYGDLDVLVRRAELADAVTALEARDYLLLDRNWDLLRALRPGELHLAAPNGVVVDLHFELVNNAERRSRFSIDPAQVIDRAVGVTIGGRSAPTADPVDTVLHLLVHTALSGGDRLGWFSDIDQAVRRRPPDWGEVVSRAQVWGIGLLAHQMLLQAARTVGTPVPPSTVHALSAGPAWHAFVTAVHGLDTVERSTGKQSVSRALSRGVHRHAAPTLTSALAARGRTGLGTRRTQFGGDHPTRQDSVLHESGGALGRAQFFELLRSADHY